MLYNVCDYLKDWCNGAAAFFRERIIDDFSPRYREMLVALDLRVLILPQAESVAKEQLSLEAAAAPPAGASPLYPALPACLTSSLCKLRLLRKSPRPQSNPTP